MPGRGLGHTGSKSPSVPCSKQSSRSTPSTATTTPTPAWSCHASPRWTSTFTSSRPAGCCRRWLTSPWTASCSPPCRKSANIPCSWLSCSSTPTPSTGRPARGEGRSQAAPVEMGMCWILHGGQRSQHHNSYGLPCRSQEKMYFCVKYIIFHYSSTEHSCNRSRVIRFTL